MWHKRKRSGAQTDLLCPYVWVSDECEGLEKLLGILTDIGYVETEDEHADFVIYNTCTVRENANNKVYGRLGYLSNFKRKIRI